MRKSLYLLLLCSSVCGAAAISQTHRYCDVYQFAGTDSAAKSVALRQTFGAAGRVVSETYTGFQDSRDVGWDNGTYRYRYRDTLLVERLFMEVEGDKSRVIFHYNPANQPIREEYFSYEKRIRKGVDKGLGRPGGCVVLESDLEKVRTWRKEKEVIYSYDSAGRKAVPSDGDYIRRRQYDAYGRMILEASFRPDGKIIVKTEYAYTDTVNRTVHSYYGYGQYLQEAGDIPDAVSVVSSALNAAGQVVAESMVNEGKTAYRKTTAYDTAGRVARTVYYNGDGLPEITHVYVYR